MVQLSSKGVQISLTPLRDHMLEEPPLYNKGKESETHH